MMLVCIRMLQWWQKTYIIVMKLEEKYKEIRYKNVYNKKYEINIWCIQKKPLLSERFLFEFICLFMANNFSATVFSTTGSGFIRGDKICCAISFGFNA